MRRKWLVSTTALIPALLLVILFVRFALPNHQSLADALASVTGLESATSSAQESSVATTSIVDVLEQLQAQNQALAGQVTDLRTQAEQADLKAVFTRTLERGDSGSDVKTLQTLLANVVVATTTATSTSDFFGKDTQGAVEAFQAQAGLAQTGIFDAQTRDALAVSMANQASTSTPAVAFTPIDLSNITDPQQEIEDLQTQMASLASALSDTQSDVENFHDQVMTLASAVSDLQNNVSTLSVTPVSVTPTPQPVAISSIFVSTTTKSSATISWTTNNPATGEIDYSTNSAMPVGQTSTARNASYVTSHTLTLTSLTAATTYYYHIISEDDSSTLANSTNLTFTTPSH